MKKVICKKCGLRRGRRQCIRYNNRFICGDCCNNKQLSEDCPDTCIHLGKLSKRDIDNKIKSLIESGISMRYKYPKESIKLFDKALGLDNSNVECLVEKSIIYESLGQGENAISCLKNAHELNNDENLIYKMAVIYTNDKKYIQAVDLLENINNDKKKFDIYYLLGECFLKSNKPEKAVNSINKIMDDPMLNKEQMNKAKLMLSKAYLEMRDTDMTIEFAQSVDNTYNDDRKKLIETAFFTSGRMYELLKFIDSLDNFDYDEKYMLLQCSMILKKNTQGNITFIIDDLLKNNLNTDKPYDDARLVCLKIKFLFKEMRMKEAYEIFEAYQDRIIFLTQNIEDCCDACYLIAFFLYNVDREKSIWLYKAATGIEVDGFMIGELYNAFLTMEIPPYVKARSIQKSVELMKKGKSDNFNRNLIAADISYEIGEYSEAYDMYGRLLNSEKQDTVIMNKMAVCLVKQNKFDNAYELYSKIITITKFIPGAYSGIIRCCLELNKEWGDYFKSMELEKLSFGEIYELAGSLLAFEYYDKAGFLYSFMMEKFKNMDIYSRKMIYHNVAGVYRSLKDYEKGIEIVKEIPKEYLSEDLLIDLGCLYYDSTQLDISRGIFENSLKDSSNPIVSFNIGVIDMRIKKYESALEHFEKSRYKVISDIRLNGSLKPKEYGSILAKIYINMSICLIYLKRMEEAFVLAEMAGSIDIDEKVPEITFIIQQQFLKLSNGAVDELPELEHLMNNCIPVNESFTEDIRNLLDSILERIYGIKGKSKIRVNSDFEGSMDSFLRNEKRIYIKNKDSVERSEGTFQRYVDNLTASFEKKIITESMNETAISLEDEAFNNNPIEHSNQLITLSDRLFKDFEYSGYDEYMYASLIPYYKSIKILCRHFLYPYYKENLDRLPVPSNPDEFREIGIFSYKTGNDISYRVDFPFNISCSEYLFDINCHPGLRSRYIDPRKHYMPWDKLLWVISGIKKKWDIIDDAKSTGLMLLFYSGFKNYLGIKDNFKDKDEVIKLAGDLIHIGNERDCCIRNMLNGEYEFDYVNRIREVREIAIRCINGLNKIEQRH